MYRFCLTFSMNNLRHYSVIVLSLFNHFVVTLDIGEDPPTALVIERVTLTTALH